MPSSDEQRPPASPISPPHDQKSTLSPNASIVSLGKRKRSHSPALVNGQKSASSNHNVQESISHIWTVLESHDPSQPFLSHLPVVDVEAEANPEPNAPKRTKLSSESATSMSTVEARVKGGAYTALNLFSSDLGDSVSHVVHALRTSFDTFNDTTPWRLMLDTIGPQELIDRLQSLARLTKQLASREIHRLAGGHGDSQKYESAKGDGILDGIKQEDVDGHAERDGNSRNVLTLFGNAQGHKQLFSSIQKPTPQTRDASGHSALREAGLPNGIASTKIYFTGTPLKKRSSTFQELFAPPSTLPPANAPKTHRSSAKTLTWTKPANAEQTPRRPTYFDEKLASGRWLGYSGLAPPEEPSSPQSKRRQRDRTLSMGANDSSASAAPEIISTAQKQAEEDALFRGAFSSFAPAFDNTAAMIPEMTRSDIWWQRYGSHFFVDTFDAGQTMGPEEFPQLDYQHDLENEEDRFRQAVDTFDPALEEPSPNGEKLLEEVSEMIETLHSFQRLRMSTLATTARPGLTYSGSQDSSGSPSTPTAAEVELYKSLKAQLALIIGTLPPYVVSKLDGDQLGELNISLQIPMEAPNYRGVMEEDQASRLAKQQAFQAAAGAARGQNTPTPGSQSQGRAQAQTARPALQPNARGNSTFARQHLSSWQTPQNPNTTVQRPPYANPQAFSQPRPGLPGAMRRPNYSQSAPRPQQPQMNGMYAGPSHAGYAQQQRPPMQNGYGSPYANSAQVGAASPRMGQNTAPRPAGPPAQYAQQQQRPPFPQGMQYQSASPQPRPSTGPMNGMSRPQTPATPMLPQQQASGPAPSVPLQGQTPAIDGRGTSGTPQPTLGTPQPTQQVEIQ